MNIGSLVSKIYHCLTGAEGGDCSDSIFVTIYRINNCKDYMKYKLSFLENFWYYVMVILSFGFWFTVKCVIKKAMSEKDANV